MKKFFDVEKLNSLSDIKFFAGEYDVKPAKILSKVAPMGKVAFISFFGTHEKYLKTLIASVLSENIKVISLIMPEPVKYSVEYAAHSFNLPDDVRAVMVIDRSLYEIASYYANVKNIPLIYVPESACVSDTFEKTFYLKNGDRYDKVEGAKTVYAVIDEKIVKKDVEKGYAFNMARLTTLIDYRVVKTSDEKLDEAYYSMLKGVTETYNVLSEEPELRPLFILYNGLTIALSDRADGFSFINSSSERVAARLNYGDSEKKINAELSFSLKLLAIYSAAFGIKKEREVFPEYLSRAEKVKSYLNIGQNVADTDLLKNIKATKKDLKKAVRAMNALEGEAQELFSHERTVKSTFYALGGKASTVDTKAIKYAGDTFFGVNVMSFLRNLGVTDG